MNLTKLLRLNFPFHYLRATLKKTGLIDVSTKFTVVQYKRANLLLAGKIITALWLIQLCILPFYFINYHIVYMPYFLYGLSICSFIFLIRIENFIKAFIEEKFSHYTLNSRKLCLLNIFFPYYLGPIWLFLTPIYVFKYLYTEESYYLSFVFIFLFVLAWFVLQVLSLNTISDKYLFSLEKKLKNPRSLLELFYFSFFILVSCCFIFYLIMKLKVYYNIDEDIINKNEIYQYRFLFNNLIASNAVFLGVIFSKVILGHFTYALQYTAPH